MDGEEPPWPREAGDPEPAVGEITWSDRNRSQVGVGVAGHLADNPIVTPHSGQNNCWTGLRLAKVGKREGDDDYRSD